MVVLGNVCFHTSLLEESLGNVWGNVWGNVCFIRNTSLRRRKNSSSPHTPDPASIAAACSVSRDSASIATCCRRVGALVFTFRNLLSSLSNTQPCCNVSSFTASPTLIPKFALAVATETEVYARCIKSSARCFWLDATCCTSSCSFAPSGEDQTSASDATNTPGKSRACARMVISNAAFVVSLACPHGGARSCVILASSGDPEIRWPNTCAAQEIGRAHV